MTESRFGIRPFPRVALYPTGWNGEMTFEQISEDIRPRAAKMLLRQYRVWAQDLDDCLQNGLMYVWEQLVADRDFLARKSRFEAAIIVCYRSKSTSIRKQNLRYEYMWRNISSRCGQRSGSAPTVPELCGAAVPLNRAF